MRVLQILSSLNRISGVANVVMNYYRMLKDKVTFDFLLYGEVEDSFAEEAESYGSKLYYLPKFGIASYGKYKKNIKKLLDEHGAEYDVVHIHELMSQRIIIPKAHEHGLKVVIHSHGPYPDRKMVGFFKAVRNKFLLKGFDTDADFFLACSEHAGKAFKKQKNVKVLKNGVDIKRYIRANGMRNELDITHNCFVVGCVGRITEQKNPLAIIDIFSEIKKIQNNSILIIAGEGEEKYISAMKNRINGYKLNDCVKFLGNCKKVPELMQSLDVFLMPSLWEGLPVVLVEAQAAGLPCYCSENIPQEANLTDNVKFLSLETDFSEWAKEIVTGKKITEAEVFEGFVKTGYELGNNAEALLEIYSGVVKR